MPTGSAAIAPTENCVVPRIAEAVPARRGDCRPSAAAILVVLTAAAPARTANCPMVKKISGNRQAAAKTRLPLLTVQKIVPARSTCAVPRRDAATPAETVAMIIPHTFTAKTAAYVWGDNPKWCTKSGAEPPR